jgi:hypothetical protein
MKKLISFPTILLALSVSVNTQQAGGAAPGPTGDVPYIFLPTPTVPDSQVDSQPIPRLADGTVDLTGPWVGGGSNVDIELEGGLKPGELPLLAWAKDLRDRRREEQEPYTVCLPMGVPRVNPYPWKFAMSYTSRGLTHIYVLHETGDAGAHRVIYMDGRKHPADVIPTWWGHSIGRWDGDTLVVDTVGYNDKFWFDSRGTPHTEQLHTVERYTRINWGRLRHEFLLDDPGAFSRPVTLNFTARLLRPDLRTGGGELMEFICLEDNQYGAAARITPGTGTNIK